MALLMGYDIGSSSIKATLMEARTGRVLASAASPDREMEIIAKKPGWAEQHPETWWENVIAATQKIKSLTNFTAGDIRGIGISYQMHGLVIVDKKQEALRPAIIWCDSRAVEIGKKALKSIGEKKCLTRLLNSPGNFTASKLKWVKDNETRVYAKIHRMMLPGDYIAMKMTGEIKTTPSGLSEAILWDFKNREIAEIVLELYGIPQTIIPEVVPAFSVHGNLTKDSGKSLGLKAGTIVSYRAGDQPNNALSLNVLNPGEIAATAGTSGVVYGITDKTKYDPKSRINTFIHVNHAPDKPRYGVMLCINGTGILNRWLKNNTGTIDYAEMNELAAKSPAGADGLVILPYGNGAERTLENQDIGASIQGLNFNIHNKSHLLRAAQEGIVFAMNYGLEIMRGAGVTVKTVRAGFANMFLSPLFAEAFATVTKSVVELYNTDGSQGAARGAGLGAGVYREIKDAFAGLTPVRTIEPNKKLTAAYDNAYKKWEHTLKSQLK